MLTWCAFRAAYFTVKIDALWNAVNTACLFKRLHKSHLFYCANKCTIKIRRRIINKVIATCFGTYAPHSGVHSPNSNTKLKNRSGHTAPALGTSSLNYALLKLFKIQLLVLCVTLHSSKHAYIKHSLFHIADVLYAGRGHVCFNLPNESFFQMCVCPAVVNINNV